MKVVSLFAGIGGFELATKKVGWDTIWSNEVDKWACETFRANFSSFLAQGDILKIEPQIIPTHDILVGGFPCQTWSLAQSIKEKMGLNDPRGHLFKEIVRILEYHKPKYFLLENAKGITMKRNREAFDMIIKELEGKGYKVTWQILNAKDYGLPQNRERVFILGNRQGLDFKWPEKQEKKLTIKDILEPEVSEKYYLSEQGWGKMLEKEWKQSSRTTSENSIFKRYFKEIRNSENCPTLHANPGGTGYPFIFQYRNRKEPRSNIEYASEKEAPTLTANMKRGMGYLPLIFQNRRGTIRENKENISPTLTGNMGTGGNNQPFMLFTESRYNDIIVNEDEITHTLRAGRQNTNILIDNRPRKLTPRECLRLQGFPDTFRIVVSNSQIYKQIGNAVAVPVVEAILKEIERQWREK